MFYILYRDNFAGVGTLSNEVAVENKNVNTCIVLAV